MILFTIITSIVFALLLLAIALGIWSVFSKLCDLTDAFSPPDPDEEMNAELAALDSRPSSLDSTAP